MRSQHSPESIAKNWEAERALRTKPQTVKESVYDVVDEVLDPKYKPQLVAKGGEHLVFTVNEPFQPKDETRVGRTRDVVVKVNFSQVWPWLMARRLGDASGEALAVESMKYDMKELKRDLAEIRRYFGSSAVPAQRFMIKEVPVNRGILDAVYEDHGLSPDQVPDSVPAWVSVQRRLDLDPERTIPLRGYYLENVLPDSPERQDLDDYAEQHRLLAQGDAAGLDDEEQRRTALRAFFDLDGAMDEVEAEPRFKTELQEVVRKMVVYTQETDKIMDLAGADNVVFLKTAKGWELKMPDALTPWDVRLHDLDDAARLLKSGKHLKLTLARRSLYALNTVRVINAMAIIAGVKERLNLPCLKSIPPETWRKELEQATF